MTLFKVRERNAPKINPSVGINGYITWKLINKSGKVTREGEQSNLILDSGLDAIAVSGLGSGTWDYMSVGTGSSAPSTTQTSLDSQVARQIGSVASTTRTADGVYLIEMFYELGYSTGNGNLTEWGASSGSSGNLFSRELFRDSGGNPITVTKTSEEILRITYYVEITISPVVPTSASLTIANIGTINGVHTFLGDNSGDLATVNRFASGIWGPEAGYPVPYLHTASLSPTISSYSSGVSVSSTSHVGTLSSYPRDSTTDFSPYVSGSYQRTLNRIYAGTGESNYQIASIAFCKRRITYTQVFPGDAGWIFLFDEADRFTKDNLHTLTFTGGPTLSWGRNT